jgi:quinol monooxygenase YgiN
MSTKGFIVRLEARSGMEESLADFLRGALPLVEQEPQTSAWFAFQVDASSFAIVDVFPDEEGRRAHLDGAVATALEESGLELFARPPLIESVEVLAARVP